MKTGLKFGIQAVQAGQKSSTVNATPQLVASSTSGKFNITSPVSKALGIAVGENVMFLNNISEVEAAINAKDERVINYAEEQGIDITSREGQDKLLAELSTWFIAKGVKQFTKTGEPLMAPIRMTTEDKEAYLEAHAMEIVEANREALIERVGNEDATDEELADSLTIDDIQAPTYHSSTGSRTATTGSATGVGCALNFTDTAIWGALKSDLEAPEKKTRVFDVLLNEPVNASVNNGFEDVEIVAYPIEFVEDKDPIVRNAKA